MERKLRYLEEELAKANIEIIGKTTHRWWLIKISVIHRWFSDNNENPEAPLPRETIPLEQDLEQLETQLREVNANQEQLNKNFLELTEVTFLFLWSHSGTILMDPSKDFGFVAWGSLILMDIVRF